MTITIRRLTLALSALTLPVLASAQAPIGQRGAVRGAPQAPAARGMPQADVTRILNARRALDLTPRQVAQLDSIERAQFTARRADQERMRQMRDTATGGMRQRAAAGASRDSLRAQNRAQMQARMEVMRPQMEQMRRRDSTARAAAVNVLTDAQRQQLREMQAEARGYQRGVREGRGARGQQGMQRRQGIRGQQNARPQLRMQDRTQRAPLRPARPEF